MNRILLTACAVAVGCGDFSDGDIVTAIAPLDMRAAEPIDLSTADTAQPPDMTYIYMCKPQTWREADCGCPGMPCCALGGGDIRYCVAGTTPYPHGTACVLDYWGQRMCVPCGRHGEPCCGSEDKCQPGAQCGNPDGAGMRCMACGVDGLRCCEPSEHSSPCFAPWRGWRCDKGMCGR